MKKAAVTKPRTKKIEDVLPSKQEPAGLCTCCNAQQTCTFPRDHGKPILQCEEFDGIIPSRLKMVSRRKTAKTPLETSIPDSSAGLCSLCEGRPTCTYPKPEGGVWHCEEYQ